MKDIPDFEHFMHELNPDLIASAANMVHIFQLGWKSCSFSHARFLSATFTTCYALLDDTAKKAAMTFLEFHLSYLREEHFEDVKDILGYLKEKQEEIKNE